MKDTRYHLDLAKSLINEYCLEEFGSEAGFDNLAEIGVAYTTVTDEEIPIQVNVNLIDFRIERYLGERLYDTRQYGDLEELIDAELNDLDFGELTYVEDEKAIAFVNSVEG